MTLLSVKKKQQPESELVFEQEDKRGKKELEESEDMQRESVICGVIQSTGEKSSVVKRGASSRDN